MVQAIFSRTCTKTRTSHRIIFRSYSTTPYLSIAQPNIRLTKVIDHNHTPISPIDKLKLLNGPYSNYPAHQNLIANSNSMAQNQSDTYTHETTNPTRSFYQRQLPDSCLSFTSDRGKALFRSALADGHLESFFPLASQLVTQHEPSFCGLATLCTVLNALGVDPKRVWKHPWRWFEQDMLDCCRPLESIRKNGITLAEFNCLARCNGLALSTQSPAIGAPEDDPIGYQTGLKQFRSQVASTTALSSAFLVVSFCRASLGQTGTGHFSPVAGYSPEEDRVLVLDVARFKYPSYWVGLEDLYKSMIPVDPASQRPRGYTTLSYSPFLEKDNCLNCNPNPPSITRINLNKSSWAILSRKLGTILESVKADPPSIAIQKIYHYISTNLAEIPDPIEIRPGLESEATKLFGQISSSTHLLVCENHLEKLSPLLIIFALAVLPSHPLVLDLKFLEPEVAYLRSQLSALGECCSLENDHQQHQHRCECKTS